MKVNHNAVIENNRPNNQPVVIESDIQDCEIIDEEVHEIDLTARPANVKSILIDNIIPFCITPENSYLFQNITQVQQDALDLLGVRNEIKAGPPTELSYESIYEFTTRFAGYSHVDSSVIIDMVANLDSERGESKQNILALFEYLGQHLINFDKIPTEILRIASEDPIEFNLKNALMMFTEFQKQGLLTPKLILAIAQAKLKYPYFNEKEFS